LKEISEIRLTIVLTYYAFTSLSTVGFGDYVPRSSEERIFVSIALYIGVLLFSYILQGFLNMVEKMKNFNYDFEECDKLSDFIGILEKFNHGRRLN
jgi:hypothetical protein